MSLRAHKAAARAIIHDRMKVRAYYLATRNAMPVAIHVRVHTEFKALGDVKGTSFDYADRQEAIPRLLFWRAEFPDPQNDAFVTISETEGYKIDFVEPPDAQTIAARVAKIPLQNMAGLPYPSTPE